jgi:hypothetical protein
MGGVNDQALPDEFPKYKVTVDGLVMAETGLTNKQFARRF